MTTNKDKNTKQQTTKRKLSTSSIILIVGCIMIAIPFVILGVILIQAFFDTGVPIIGDRFEGDLDPAITSADQDEIVLKCGAIQNVEACTISLKTATVRLYVDTKDAISDEEATIVADAAYGVVTSRLSKDSYFTSTETKKMYDLEVHVYNSLDKADSDDYMYVVLNKSAKMLEPHTQIVSEPLDADLAEQLRNDVENRNNPKPTAETEVEVGGEESENTEKDGE